jgi:hypothetical protein
VSASKDEILQEVVRKLSEDHNKLVENFRQNLTDLFSSRAQGRGGLSKKSIDDMASGFADGCMSTRASITRMRGLIRHEELAAIPSTEVHGSKE